MWENIHRALTDRFITGSSMINLGLSILHTITYSFPSIQFEYICKRMKENIMIFQQQFAVWLSV